MTAPILLLGTVATAATVISLAAQPTVAGELVKLRPVCASAAATFAFLAAATLRPTGTQRSYRVAELERWYSSRAEPHGRLDWAIIARAAGECAGEVVLNELNRGNLSCDFRVRLVGAPYCNRGLGPEATELAARHSFQTVGLNRTELEVYSFNPRARWVCAKAGFGHEGKKLRALLGDGSWVDAKLMALLADDWFKTSGTALGRL
ncbi:MAG: GNAT family N-acetyltransferase [Candidatus Dormibacteria bacterium]